MAYQNALILDPNLILRATPSARSTALTAVERATILALAWSIGACSSKPHGKPMRTAIRAPGLVLLAVLALGLSAAPCPGQARMRVEAVAGQPFGVGRILFEGERGAGGSTDSATLVERSARIYYPAYVWQPVRQLLRNFVAAPQRSTIYFLFEGDAPLELSVYAPGPHSRTIRPAHDPVAHEQLLRAWWGEYPRAAERWAGGGDDSSVVQNYLVTTLARRLRFDPPAPSGPQPNQARDTLELLLGTERLRVALEREMLLQPVTSQVADQQVPEPLPVGEPLFVVPKRHFPIEPIAAHVPAECLYMRFGSFPNFLWFRHRMDEWGGDVRNLISERGVDYRLDERLQRQLALRENVLAELLGERVIADVAVIGTDTFLRDGAAMGMLFHARNSGALRADIMRQRIESLKQFPGATEEKFKIAEHDVNFISTSDNRLRSFYVIDGDFHLVTTSRTIARRFLEAGRGVDALGGSQEFRFARSKVPLAGKQSIFIYLSKTFLRNLAGPHYRVESMRRVRSAGQIELVLLARLAARAERKRSETLDDLIAAEALPEGFGQRWDGSQLVYENGEVYDSLRGTRGTFVPVPDVEMKRVTASEAREYNRFYEYFESEWREVNPILVAVDRSPAGKDLERVTVNIEAAALADRQYQTLSRWLGPPMKQRLTRSADDMVHGQVSISGDNPLARGAPPHRLFGALRDADPRVDSQPSGLLSLLAPRDIHGYAGAIPGPGMLGMFAGPNIASGPDGFAQLRTGLWRREFGEFTLLSFHPEILDDVAPQLHFGPAKEPAQLWLHADDLQGTRLADTINKFGYRYARGIAQNNIQFMNVLAEQLHVPRKHTREIAELLLGAKLVSPVGGDYELRAGRGGLPQWVVVRSQPDAQERQIPPYQFPALEWLRELDVEARLEPSSLTVHIEAIMPAQPVKTFPLPAMPSFPSFVLPGFGGNSKEKPKEAQRPPAESKRPAPAGVTPPAEKPAPSAPVPTDPEDLELPEPE